MYRQTSWVLLERGRGGGENEDEGGEGRDAYNFLDGASCLYMQIRDH